MNESWANTNSQASLWFGHGLDLVGVITFLHIIYFTNFGEGWHSNDIFSHDFQLGIPKLSNYESYHLGTSYLSCFNYNWKYFKGKKILWKHLSIDIFWNVLMINDQIGSLIFNSSNGHNICFRSLISWCDHILVI